MYRDFTVKILKFPLVRENFESSFDKNVRKCPEISVKAKSKNVRKFSGTLMPG